MAARNKTVYSTDPDWEPHCNNCGLPESECICSHTVPAPDKQNLKVLLDRKGRKGKTVTVIKGFAGDIKSMQKQLQQLCGTGGSVKGDQMELQGDHCNTVIDFFRKRGDVIKKSGG